MPKNLVLCSDGTGNSSAKAQKTNVWRMFQCVDQGDPAQLVHYDDGVGTSRNKYLAALGGAFGWGLKRNVIDLYEFACRNYQDGDRIYGFGFSRGAFTIRMVVGLIASQGLVQCETEEQMHRAAKAAFRRYRWQNHWKWHHLLLALRYLLGLVLAAKDTLFGERYRDIPRIEQVPIRFLGLWDTVAAYEMPIEEIKRAIDFWLWPMSFGDLALSPRVVEACHALALDEERETFHPAMWDEAAEAQMVAAGKVAAGRVQQVWFAGVHSNVGGGYDEDQLSYVPFEWIADRARGAQVVFDGAAVAAIKSAASPFARMYDSRQGVAAFYRYAPRLLQDTVPTVHWSVMMRMGEGSDAYAPISLPAGFRVLAPDGSRVRFADAVDLVRHPDPAMQALGYAMLPLGVPDARQVEAIWDLVWWRRAVYFGAMVLAFALLAYPLIAEHILLGERTADVEQASRGIVAMLADAASAFIPGYFTPWLDAIREHPVAFGAMALGLAYMLYLEAFLGQRIEDRAFRAWRLTAGTVHTYARRESVAVWRLLALALAALLLLACSVYFEWTKQARMFWIAVFGIVLFTMVSRIEQKAKLASVAAGGEPAGRRSPSLAIAHFFRTWGPSRLANRLFTHAAIPLVFLVAMAWAFVSVVNKALLEVATSIDAGCEETSNALTPGNAWQSASTPFRTDAACWPSGFLLEKGARYQVKLEMADDWFDGGQRADVGGVTSGGWAQAAGMGLKRWWRADWLQPIARIGTIGNDEYELEPLVPYAQHRYGNAAPTRGACQPLDEAAARQAASSDPTPSERRTLVAEITARSTGPLYLYANDAEIAFAPGWCFRTNNRGSATVSVRRITAADLAR